MPVMDGFEASTEILKHFKEEGLEPPVIVALTAYNTEEVKERCKQCGMKEFLAKPVNLEAVSDVFKKYNILW